MRSTARVIVGDQVWSLNAEAAARWSVTVGGLPRPLPADAVDTTAETPVWHGGDPIPGCVRWATPADLTQAGMLTARAARIGGGRS